MAAHAPLDWRLLHLADSALPTGAYAFSYGLEAAAKLGLIRTLPELEQFIRGAILQARRFEMAFVRGCFETDAISAVRMVQEYDAALTVPEIRHASSTLGITWLRLMQDLYGEGCIRQAREFMGSADHFVIIFSCTLRAAGYNLAQVCALFHYACLRDLISAAIRLGLIGPARGHALLHALCGDTAFQEQAVPDWQHAYRSYPILDLAQAAHCTLYSRLFQN